MHTTHLSTQAIEFITVSLAYCTALEDDMSEHTTMYFDKLSKILPLLYLKASLVDTTNSNEVYEDVEKFVTEHEYQFIQAKIASLFGAYDNYLEVSEEVDTPIMGSISEDLADVYQDIKDLVMNAKVGNPEVVSIAVKICIENFQQYWGQKLLSALKQIHSILYNNELENVTDESILQKNTVKKQTFSDFLRDEEDDYSNLL